MIIVKCQTLFLISFFVAKRQATSLSIKYLDMLLHAQHVMAPNGCRGTLQINYLTCIRLLMYCLVTLMILTPLRRMTLS